MRVECCAHVPGKDLVATDVRATFMQHCCSYSLAHSVLFSSFLQQVDLAGLLDRAPQAGCKIVSPIGTMVYALVAIGHGL